MTKRALRIGLTACVALTLLSGVCLLPSGMYSQVSNASSGNETTAGAPAEQAVLPQPEAETGTAPPASPALTAASPAPASTSSAVVFSDETIEEEAAGEEDPAAEEEQEEGEPDGDVPRIAAWTSQAPANFKVTYSVANHTATCTWNAVTSPVPHDYRLYKWDRADYSSVSSIYQQLTVIDPATTPSYNDWKATMDTMIANTPGYTYTERQNALDTIQEDADILNGVLCGNSSAASLLTQMKKLATKRNLTGTSYADTSISNNYYYWYAVVTRNSSHVDTSPFSHTDYTFTVRNNSTKPAVPKGVTAKAYDPGVFVEWSRNQEYDLAGYNVYLVTGSTWTKLNTSLVTIGTEYYYANGTAGQVFGVTAVDTSSPARESSKTSKATAALQPATVYLATDPGWTTTGTWKVEYYTLLPPPDTGPADLLVVQDTNAKASHAFTGRRVRLYVSTYWSCGSARIYVDGQAQGTVSLGGGDTPSWGVSVFTISGLCKGSHTFSIECLGTGGSYGFNFVNLQYIEVR